MNNTYNNINITYCKHCGIKLKLDSKDLLAKQFICPRCKKLNYVHEQKIDQPQFVPFDFNVNQNRGIVLITCPYCHNQVKPINISKTSTGGIIFFVLFLSLAMIIFLYVLYLASQYVNYYYFDIGNQLRNYLLGSIIILVIFLGISLIGFTFRDNYKLCPRCKMKLG